MPKPITHLLVVFFFPLLAVPGAGQSCSITVDCPNGNLKICDITGNDPLFWQAPPYTWDPLIEQADLFETSADLSLTFRDTCPGALTVKFLLFLDLDGDNLTESVLTSDHILPAGRMLSGNAFSPGYAGTDTLIYDNRPVPDSMKFRFVVETVALGGGLMRAYLRWETPVAPGSYVAPRLPQGRHHVIWRLEKPALAPVSCELTFHVEDCMAPQLECASVADISLPSKDTLWITAADLVDVAMDNSTPANLLEFSLRPLGAGMGFPENAQGQPIAALPFTCADIGQHFIEVWVRDLAGNASMCSSNMFLFDPDDVCKQVDPYVCATTVSVNHDTIQGVHYHLETMVEPGLPPIHLAVTPLPNGCVELPDFSPYLIEEAAVTPHKNNRWLDGVSTFDLVLINRHILGIQLLDEPWKYWAADANNSKTITTFDIVELRKLILGTYDSLPQCPAWRFFIADCALDSLQPLQSICPATLVFNPNVPPEQFLFYGVKTGDVNGNAVGDSIKGGTLVRAPVRLQVEDLVLEAGQTFELPVFPDAPVDWAACQLALNWDAEKIELTDVDPGGLPGLDASMWTTPSPGNLRVSWNAATACWLTPRTPLFTLRGRATSTVHLKDVLRLKTTPLRAEGYALDGAVSPLQLEFRTMPFSAGIDIFPPQPNPTSGGTVFPVDLPVAGDVSLEIRDGSGRLIFQKQMDCAAGPGAIEVPDAAFLTPGVYVWRVQVADQTKSGRLIRL
ncbi:MAG: hypothetical protein EP344_02330 [Bacteroidetes bacterium]|nr:MAG: hypothetical protein EP344_02330 [Bacteroidota bacterium]